jgi:hypothetical protein
VLVTGAREGTWRGGIGSRRGSARGEDRLAERIGSRQDRLAAGSAHGEDRLADRIDVRVAARGRSGDVEPTPEVIVAAV